MLGMPAFRTVRHCRRKTHVLLLTELVHTKCDPRGGLFGAAAEHGSCGLHASVYGRCGSLANGRMDS